MTPVLQWALPLALIMLALAMGCALLRMLKGPSAQDRVLALDCMALNGMLLMLVLGLHYSSKNYFEAALLLALTVRNGLDAQRRSDVPHGRTPLL